jgi:hypothetical protein
MMIIQSKFMSTSGRKFEIMSPQQARYDDTLLYGIYCSAVDENNDDINLNVLFGIWFTQAFGKQPNQIGPLEQSVIDVVERKFKTLLFYDKIEKLLVIQITFEQLKEQTEDKMIFGEFEILRTSPIQLRCRGYPNFNADLSRKVEIEIMRGLYTNYGNDLTDEAIQQDLYYESEYFSQACQDLIDLGYVTSPAPHTKKLTRKGMEYYRKALEK